MTNEEIILKQIEILDKIHNRSALNIDKFVEILKHNLDNITKIDVEQAECKRDEQSEWEAFIKDAEVIINSYSLGEIYNKDKNKDLSKQKELSILAERLAKQTDLYISSKNELNESELSNNFSVKGCNSKYTNPDDEKIIAYFTANDGDNIINVPVSSRQLKDLIHFFQEIINFKCDK